jgi:DNA-binding beta-propeller fold protein YncE
MSVSLDAPPAHLLVPQPENLAYVTLPDNGTIAVISTETGRFVDKIAIEGRPHGLAALPLGPAGSYIFFVAMGDGLPAATNGGKAKEGTIVAAYPTYITLAGFFDGFVVVRGVGAISLVDAIALPQPGGPAPSGQVLFAGLHVFDGDYQAALFSLDTRTGSEIDEVTFLACDGPARHIAVDADGTVAYVSDNWGFVFRQDLLLEETNMLPTFCDSADRDLALSADGARLYVGSNLDCEGITVVDTRARSVQATMPIRATALTIGSVPVEVGPSGHGGCHIEPGERRSAFGSVWVVTVVVLYQLSRSLGRRRKSRTPL